MLTRLTSEQQALVTKYIPLAFREARRCWRPGFQLEDLVSEAQIGLCHAAARFDRSRDVSFYTYAKYWARALVLAHIVNNYGPVRFATTPRARKVMFGIGRARRAVGEDPGAIANYLGVSREDVERVVTRLSNHDKSLDDKQRHTIIAMHSAEDHEEALNSEAQRALIRTAMSTLDQRERLIIESRFMRDEPRSLLDLGEYLGISRERARQIEARAVRKLREEIENPGRVRQIRPCRTCKREEAVEGRRLGQSCIEKERANKRKIVLERKATGMCVQCGKRKVVFGMKCLTCRPPRREVA